MDDTMIDFARRLDAELMAKIAASTVAILTSDQSGTMYQRGSGVLLTIARRRLVLTAAHVMDGVPLYISTGNGQGISSPSAPLEGFSSRIPEGKTRDEDYLDYCVFEVPAEDLPHLSKKSFITLNEIDFKDDQHPKSRYLAFGFPQDYFDEPNASQSALSFLTHIYDVSKQMPDEHVPRREIVLDYSSDSARDAENQATTLPIAKGMSGCGIWRMLHGTVNMSDWKPEQVKLVGIQFSYVKNKFLRGTRIGYLLDAIYRRNPDLQPGMRLSYP